MINEDNKVKVVIVGCGMKKDTKHSLSPLSIISSSYEIQNAIEFGKFMGDFVGRAETKKQASDGFVIPSTARSTWNVKRIKGGSPELFVKWSRTFSDSDVNVRELSSEEVLSHWLKISGDENIRKALMIARDE